MHKRSVFIIGAGGMVGATAAQAIALKEIVQDIALIDVAEDVVRGQALDINHATAYTDGVRVRVGDYIEIQQDDIVVITSGAALKPGQTRLELLEINKKIITEVVAKIMAQGKPVFILMVANPVDVLTKVALQASGLPKERVFGTGTTVDSARLRVTLANKLGVSQRGVQGYILGEHGDSSFAVLSGITVNGNPLNQFPGYDAAMTDTIDQDIRNAAYEIIKTKKSTWGIGSTIAKVVEAMLHDTGAELSVCSLAQGEYGLNDVVIGLPSIVNSRGVKILDAYPLTDGEQQKLHQSAEVIRKAAASGTI